MKINVEIRKSKLITDDFSAVLSFSYDSELIDYIREFEERYWNNDKKTWEISLEEFSELIEDFPEHEYDITGVYVDLTPKEIVKPTNFKFKTKPFAHQIVGFNYGVLRYRWLLGDEQGLGKTKQSIDIAVAKKLTDHFNHCLIICGVNGLKWNWLKEVSIHSDESACILGQRQKKNGKLVIGSNADKLEDLKHLDSISDYFLITNIESLRSDDILQEIRKWIDMEYINMIIVDEIHKCKSISSQQGKALLKLQPEYRLALTGTPLMNSPLDLYVILRWLGYEKHTWSQFKRHYAVFGGFGGYEIVGYKHIEDLQEQLESIMLRRLKADVLDLPDKLYIDEFVDMLPKQQIIYKEVNADIKMNIDNIEISPNPLAEMIRLRQATGWTGILSSEIGCSAKIDRALELIADIVENGRKVVVFSNWSQITQVLFDKLQDYGVAYFTGETSDSDRRDAIEYFQEDESCQIIIGTFGALGTGVTLTAADTVILLDEPWSKANEEQAIDRLHRIGQQNNITIYRIMCKDTIDERIHELVETKGMIADMMVDGKIIDKKELVRFLLS